jgi:hypothetical protein
MKSTLTFALSTGRAVEISLRATDGRRLQVAEVFEVIRHCGREVGDFGRELARAGQEAALLSSLRRIVRPAPSGAVSTADLVRRLRPLHRTLTAKRIMNLLPRIMTVHYGHGVSNDLPGRTGCRRGYRGIALRATPPRT